MRARLLMIGAAMVVAPALLVGCGSSSKSSSSTQPTGGGLTVDRRFFLKSDDYRLHQVHLEGGDSSSDSYCYP